MSLKSGNNKTPSWQTFAELPSHIQPPKPMTAEDLDKPAPSQEELKILLRKVLAHVCTPDKMQHLVFKLYDCARNGDKWAAGLLFDMIRGVKESADKTVEQSNAQPLSRKQVEDELAKLGWGKVTGLNCKTVGQSNSPAAAPVSQSNSPTPKDSPTSVSNVLGDGGLPR